MLAIIDHRTPPDTINELSRYVDDIHLFKSEGITYNSISGHPDIFIYQDESNFIIAPNSPFSLFEFLEDHKVSYTTGVGLAGHSLADSTRYNCISSDKFFLHKKGFTDKSICRAVKDKMFINLPQAYTRCSLTHLCNDKFITSDLGIEKELLDNNLECFYFNPSEITIEDHNHGFLGGTAGVYGNKIFFNGNIDIHEDGNTLRDFVTSAGMEIINLGTDYLYDGGCIFFIQN